jgi:hypothetical protein
MRRRETDGRREYVLAFRVVFWEVPRRPMRVRPFVRFVVSTAALALAALPVACSNQGEGEFCDTRFQNDDCQSGLVCVEQAPGLSAMEGIVTSRCCPSDSTQATTAACMTNVAGVGDASNEVGEASVDAASEAGSSEVDAAPEAGRPADASAASADAAHDASAFDGADHVAPALVDAAADAGTDASIGGDAADGAPD